MKKLWTLCLLSVSFMLLGQKVSLESGDLSFLKDEKEINVKFEFSDLKFYNENLSEKEYIAKKRKEIEDKKDKAEADNWQKDWEKTKKESIPAKFFASFDKYATNGMKAVSGKKTPYTLVVSSFWIYPGWFGGVMQQPSKASMLLKFVETKNPANELAVVKIEKSYGDNFVGIANNNDRIAEAYAKASKSFWAKMGKKIK